MNDSRPRFWKSAEAIYETVQRESKDEAIAEIEAALRRANGQPVSRTVSAPTQPNLKRPAGEWN